MDTELYRIGTEICRRTGTEFSVTIFGVQNRYRILNATCSYRIGAECCLLLSQNGYRIGAD